MPYAAKATHDGQPYEWAIPEVQISKCSVSGELVFASAVDEQITEALRTRLMLLAPEQIRVARIRLCLGPQELAERLGTTAETLARWEDGTVLQSRTLDNLLRVFFALPEVRSVLTGANQDPGLGLQVNSSNR